MAIDTIADTKPHAALAWAHIRAMAAIDCPLLATVPGCRFAPAASPAAVPSFRQHIPKRPNEILSPDTRGLAPIGIDDSLLLGQIDGEEQQQEWDASGRAPSMPLARIAD